MPSLSISRKKEAPLAARYTVMEAFVAEVPSFGSWAPKIGTNFPSDHPGVAWLARQPGQRLLVASDATWTEQQAARDEAYLEAIGAPPADPFVRLGEAVPSEHRVRSTRNLYSGMTVLTFAGTIHDDRSPLVKAHPDCFEPEAGSP
jgi:hypothetical protein